MWESELVYSACSESKYVFFVVVLVKYAESSSDSSDDEPLTTMEGKQKTLANSKKTKPKPKNKSLKGRQHFH